MKTEGREGYDESRVIAPFLSIATSLIHLNTCISYDIVQDCKTSLARPYHATNDIRALMRVDALDVGAR
jgi:hypothetical protein